jgi:hypothetical protein
VYPDWLVPPVSSAVGLPGAGRGHIVGDILAEHVSHEPDAWFEDHPRWTRHLTPKRASWLNRIEVAFGDLQRRVLARGSFASAEDLDAKVLAYVRWCARGDGRPHNWTDRPDTRRGESRRHV